MFDAWFRALVSRVNKASSEMQSFLCCSFYASLVGEDDFYREKFPVKEAWAAELSEIVK